MVTENLWVNQARWPIDFTDKVFLFRAINRVGAKLYPVDWVGNEHSVRLVRQLPFSRASVAPGDAFSAYLFLKAKKPDLFKNDLRTRPGYTGPPWHHWTSDLWRAAVTAHNEENDKRTPATLRFSTACIHVLQTLMDGRLQTFTRPKMGGSFIGPFGIDTWNTERWPIRFISGQMDPNDRFSNASESKGSHYIFVDRHGLDILETTLLNGETEPVTKVNLTAQSKEVFSSGVNKVEPSIAVFTFDKNREGATNQDIHLAIASPIKARELRAWFLERIRNWPNGQSPNKEKCYQDHRTHFKERELPSREFMELRQQGGVNAMVPQCWRKPGKRGPGWRKNLTNEWQEKLQFETGQKKTKS